MPGARPVGCRLEVPATAEWVIEGEKWFSSNARFATFFLVIAAPRLRLLDLPARRFQPGPD